MTPGNSQWRQARIGDVLTYSEERVQLDPAAEYITITVKRRHAGLEERERVSGHQIKTAKQFRLIPGAFIISRVQCWHEAYAIVPDDAPPNMIASTNYDQFAISPTVDKRFFWWLSHSPYFRETIRSSAFGVVIEKMVFNRDTWLSKSISLPPLEEQQRIVARIESLAAQITQARLLRQEADKETQALVQSNRSRIAAALSRQYGARTIASLCSKITDGEHITPTRTDQGQILLSARNIQNDLIDLTVVDHVPDDEFHRIRKRCDPSFGDILISCSGSIGKIALVDADATYVMVRSVAMIRPIAQIITSEFMAHMLRSDFCQIQMRAKARQAAQANLFLGKIREISVPTPPLDEQKQISEELSAFGAKVDSLNALQADTSGRLTSLLPSILDRAFRAGNCD